MKQVMNKPQVIRLELPEYDAEDPSNFDIVAARMDLLLAECFEGRSVLIRCIDCKDHRISRECLITLILREGHDRYKVKRMPRGYEPQDIDLCAYQITEPLQRERPYFNNRRPFDSTNITKEQIIYSFWQYEPSIGDVNSKKRIDLALIYDAEKMVRVDYEDARYPGDLRLDGFKFLDPNDKVASLLGILNFT